MAPAAPFERGIGRDLDDDVWAHPHHISLEARVGMHSRVWSWLTLGKGS